MSFIDDSWINGDGDWQVRQGHLAQVSRVLGLPTRRYRQVAAESYQVRFRARMLEATGPNGRGELKFLYTDADGSDELRFDFLVPQRVVRLTVGGLQFFAPFHFAVGDELGIAVENYGTSVSLVVNDLPLYDRVPIGKHFNGWVGVGTYEATAEFWDLSIKPSAAIATSSPPAIRLFISHSGQDAELAGKLARLFQVALHLRPTAIRCTSADGFRLPAGARTEDQLRTEVLSAPILVGLISHASIKSTFVLFELGARWGAQHPMIPLLAPGVSKTILRSPLSELNAVECGRQAELVHLLEGISGIIAEPLVEVSTYLPLIEEISQLRPTQPVPDNVNRAPAVRQADADYGEVDYCSMLESWMNGQTDEEKLQVIHCRDVDRVLGLPAGTALRLLPTIGQGLGYATVRRGVGTLIFRDADEA